MTTKIEARSALQADMLDHDIWHSCINCLHFSEKGKDYECLMYKQKPPVGIVVLGCKAWEADIPF